MIIALIVSSSMVRAEEKSPVSAIDSIAKSARDMLPSMPSLPSVSLPSMPDLSIPDFSDTSSRVAKASGGVLVSALISSAAAAKRIQNTMKLGVAYLDVDFALPPRVSMRFTNPKATGNDDAPRDYDDLEIACR